MLRGGGGGEVSSLSALIWKFLVARDFLVSMSSLCVWVVLSIYGPFQEACWLQFWSNSLLKGCCLGDHIEDYHRSY